MSSFRTSLARECQLIAEFAKSATERSRRTPMVPEVQYPGLQYYKKEKKKISWIGIARVAITAPASKERGSDRGQSSSQIPTQRMAAPPCPSLLGAEPPATTSKGGRRVAPPPPPHWKKEELFGEGSNSRGGSAQIRSSSVRVYWFRVS
ncbi:hypothetical protein Ahy_B08g092430 isoform B [Arachis hypogaea]|uniref:Uncharacterized protein n=1 Tax=Arachis hypogaea TaxID=3818 RepID=A0A444Y3Z1_ARAHY|nr:hypothetical protein Ahy_B08g092430 isoform B [Arachis hypogaea]